MKSKSIVYMVVAVMVLLVGVPVAEACGLFGGRMAQRRAEGRGLFQRLASPANGCGGSMAARVNYGCAGSAGYTVQSYGCAGSQAVQVQSYEEYECIPCEQVQGSSGPDLGSEAWSRQMAYTGRFIHDRSYNGRENIAKGVSTPEQAVRIWRTSPGHRRNLPYLSDIKCVQGPFGTYCTGR